MFTANRYFCWFQMCGLWATAKLQGHKFGNYVGDKWKEFTDWTSDHAETLGKVADAGIMGLGLLGGVPGALAANALMKAKGKLAENYDEDSAWGKFARNGKKGEEAAMTKYKQPFAIGHSQSNQQQQQQTNSSYSADTQSSGGRTGRYALRRSVR